MLSLENAYSEEELQDWGRRVVQLAGTDAVIHFAGLLSVADSVADPASYYRTNVVKGLALLEAMQAAGVRDIVFSSTCAVYGIPVRVPIDEDHPKDPINPYGATKLAFERALDDLSRAGRLRAVESIQRISPVGMTRFASPTG